MEAIYHHNRAQGSALITLLDSNHSFEKHVHLHSFTVGKVTKGAIILTKNEIENFISTGNTFVVLPGEPHAISPATETYSLTTWCIRAETRYRSADPLVQALLTAAISCPEARLHLSDLSAELGVSKYKLIRKLKAELGLTPHQLLIHQRVKMAQKLIEKNVSLSEVAYLSGFHDQSHLNKYFKRMIGVTPMEYRQCSLA